MLGTVCPLSMTGGAWVEILKYFEIYCRLYPHVVSPQKIRNHMEAPSPTLKKMFHHFCHRPHCQTANPFAEPPICMGHFQRPLLTHLVLVVYCRGPPVGP